MKTLFLMSTLLATTTMAHGQSIVLGAGYADFTHTSSNDQAVVSLEYQHSPFHEATRLSAGWGVALTVDADADTHIGAGLVGLYTISDRWFAEASVMPGYYNASNDDNDLGGNFQIRSLFGIGYALENGNKLSLAITHNSNASTDSFNPGVNSVFMRYHYGF
ncbi:acyloxyacyl hydrolase [Ruegeria faecimaris]|uniref:Lipid A 3-O-deacylase (PagL) n=1 Tax=Ruegeria faecimaris TaxID=686389 RepID=A0A521EXE5_9RHOB|nr:acyloxyacyl hydrolase [Ruegeria faecimaris]SMO88567.1 Lipid A 3-O-deacylase (PagL) [Ruegeria faecimaris]